MAVLLSSWRVAVAGLAVAASGLLGACDDMNIKVLQEGEATEFDVRDRFGKPDQVWAEDDGARTLEFNRQPAGQVNYMITIGADGKLQKLRQVLAPAYFDQVQPGMNHQQVRRLLGKPAKQVTYDLKQQTEWDWNWSDSPGRDMEFTVVFDSSGQVLRAGSHEKLHNGP